MKNKSKIIGLIICCVLLMSFSSAASADEKSFTDGHCDVYKLSDQDLNELLNQSMAGGSLTGFDDLQETCKDDIDIKSVQASKNNKQISINLQVYGKINDGTNLSDYQKYFEGLDENAGYEDILNLDLPDIIITSYTVTLKTSKDEYYISYQQGEAIMQSMTNQINVSHVKNDDTLTFNAELSESEKIEDINVSTSYMEGSYISMILSMVGGGGDSGLGSLGSFESYIDVAPEPGFSVYATAEPDTAEPDEEVQFNAKADSGVPQYTYKWEFGDGTISNEQNPTHKYTKEGTYNVKVVATDSIGNETEFTFDINISHEAHNKDLEGSDPVHSEGNNGDRNGDTNDNNNDGLVATTFGDSGLVAFIALVAAILVVGLAVLYYISKR